MKFLLFPCLLLVASAAASALPSNQVQEFECVNPFINCAEHGVCISNGTFAFACKCDPGYVTYNCAPSVQCCYSQESRVKMFLLSFFFGGIGVPYFVLGAAGLGAGILILCCGGCLLGTVAAYRVAASEGHSRGWKGLYCLGFLALLATVAWWNALWIQFAAETETVNDKNGVPVGPW